MFQTPMSKLLGVQRGLARPTLGAHRGKFHFLSPCPFRFQTFSIISQAVPKMMIFSCYMISIIILHLTFTGSQPMYGSSQYGSVHMGGEVVDATPELRQPNVVAPFVVVDPVHNQCGAVIPLSTPNSWLPYFHDGADAHQWAQFGWTACTSDPRILSDQNLPNHQSGSSSHTDSNPNPTRGVGRRDVRNPATWTTSHCPNE